MKNSLFSSRPMKDIEWMQVPVRDYLILAVLVWLAVITGGLAIPILYAIWLYKEHINSKEKDAE